MAVLPLLGGAGTPLVSLMRQEKLSVGLAAPAASGKLTVGYGTPGVKITTPDLYCTATICFHGVETTL